MEDREKLPAGKGGCWLAHLVGPSAGRNTSDRKGEDRLTERRTLQEDDKSLARSLIWSSAGVERMGNFAGGVAGRKEVFLSARVLGRRSGPSAGQVGRSVGQWNTGPS